MPKRLSTSHVAIKNFDYFAEDDMKRLNLPKKLAAACRKDRLVHRKLAKRERLFEPGAIKRFKLELTDELVDFINYCINIRYLRTIREIPESPRYMVDENLFRLAQQARIMWQTIDEIKREIK